MNRRTSALLAAMAAVMAPAAAAQHTAHAPAPVPTVAEKRDLAPPPGTQGGRDERVVTVTATDFAFDAPDVVAAGRMTFRLINQGQELHHVQIVRLEDGRTLEELLEAFAAGGRQPAWARDVGGPNAATPGGGEFSATVTLRPGTYALLCVIPSPDGTPHIMKGMSRPLTVTEEEPAEVSGGTEAIEAPVDLTLTLTDYAFGFSKALTPGTHRIRVQTVAPQSHEIVVVRMEEGRTAQDVLAWFEGGQSGPPPGVPVGGIVGLAPGEENEFTLSVEQGRYAFICFLPDIGDGQPHFVHGMIQDYEVR